MGFVHLLAARCSSVISRKVYNGAGETDDYNDCMVPGDAFHQADTIWLDYANILKPIDNNAESAGTSWSNGDGRRRCLC